MEVKLVFPQRGRNSDELLPDRAESVCLVDKTYFVLLSVTDVLQNSSKTAIESDKPEGCVTCSQYLVFHETTHFASRSPSL